MTQENSTAQTLEARIRANRLTDFTVDWRDELIFPYYDGLSLRNLPHTIANVLGAPLHNSYPLEDEVWQAPTPEARRVVVFLMDGMGYKHLQLLMADDAELQDAVTVLNGGRQVIPLTSVAPSTTVVALTTLWTGGTPGQTGLSGTLMFLRELSLLGNMLAFAPTAGRHPQDVFATWGLDPEQIVKMPGLSQHLSGHGILTHIITNKRYVGTGLSRILHRGVGAITTHKGHQDMVSQVRKVLMDTRGEHQYINIYWEAVDSLAHEYGAHSDETRTEIRRQIIALRDLITDPAVQDGETLFILLADHGHYDATVPIDLGEDPVIQRALRMSVSGDERHAYLSLEQGMLEDVKSHLDSHYADKLAYIDSRQAIECGYFGQSIAPDFSHRIGDLILLPRTGNIIADPYLGTLPIISRHAGLSDWEMLIPFIWRLM